MATIKQGFFDQRQIANAAGTLTSVEVPYFVFDVADTDATSAEQAAINAVKSSAPAKISTLYLQRIEIDERINETTFKVIAHYESNDAEDRAGTTGESTEDEDYGNANPTTAFDTTGGTQHITTSLETVSKYPTNAPDFGKAIGVDGDGNVNGVDITMPTMTFSETHYFKPSRVSSAYQKKLFTMTGCVNNDTFRGFAAKEVLFLGASARRTGSSEEDLWEITFNFAVSPSQTVNVPNVGDVTKSGWDYLWLRYGDQVSNNNLVKTPIAAYVERVYRVVSFAGLGIDTKAE